MKMRTGHSTVAALNAYTRFNNEKNAAAVSQLLTARRLRGRNLYSWCTSTPGALPIASAIAVILSICVVFVVIYY
jgi:hypothetical protein